MNKRKLHIVVPGKDKKPDDKGLYICYKCRKNKLGTFDCDNNKTISWSDIEVGKCYCSNN